MSIEKNKMRIGMYYHNNDVRVEEMPVPKIEAGEILVKVNASGICGSDVLEWYRIKKAPLVLGHEIAGEIVETGVDRFEIGNRVFVSHHVPCNRCWYCLHGKHTVCRTLHSTHFDPGGFAEYIRVPRINVDFGTFVLPDEMSYEEASFIEPLACVVRGQRLAQVLPGMTVVVIGSGISGLLHILTARTMGAGCVISTDINKYRLEKAKELGANKVFHAKDDIPYLIRKSNNNRLADIVIICTGALSAFSQAMKSIDYGGTILCFATTEPGVEVPLPVNEFWRNGITVLPSYANSPYDAKVAIELIKSGQIPVNTLITHRLGLSEIGLGFKLVAKAQESIKVIINPQQ